MKVAFSVNGVPIRLTEERVKHIHQNHPEVQEEERLLETVSNPDLIQKGDSGTLLAVKGYGKTPVEKNKYLVVVYKELTPSDGFVLTSYYTSNLRKRRIIWKS